MQSVISPMTVIMCTSTILQLMHLNITAVDILHFFFLTGSTAELNVSGDWLLEIGFRVSFASRFLISNALLYYPMLNGILVVSILSSHDSQSRNIKHQVYLMGKDQFAERCSCYPDLMILTFLPEEITYFTNVSLFFFLCKKTFSGKNA